MMEFKAGDKLRYIGAKSHYYTVGNVYELQEARRGAFWLTDDESNEVANHEWDFWDLEANFERINELQFKVGDKVRVVNVGGITLGEKHYYNGFVTKVLAVSSGIDDAGVVLENKHGVEGVYIDADELMDGVIELVEADGDTAALTKTMANNQVQPHDKAIITRAQLYKTALPLHAIFSSTMNKLEVADALQFANQLTNMIEAMEKAFFGSVTDELSSVLSVDDLMELSEGGAE